MQIQHLIMNIMNNNFHVWLVITTIHTRIVESRSCWHLFWLSWQLGWKAWKLIKWSLSSHILISALLRSRSHVRRKQFAWQIQTSYKYKNLMLQNCKRNDALLSICLLKMMEMILYLQRMFWNVESRFDEQYKFLLWQRKE